MSEQQHYAKDGICTTCRQSAPCQWIAERAAQEWRELAAAFNALSAYLEPGRTGTTGGARSTPQSKPPMSVRASDLIREIEDWAWFYASALMDETDDYVVPATTAERLRDIAERYGHFTMSDDERWVQHKRRPDSDMPEGHWQRVALDYCDMAHEMHRRAVGLVSQPPPARFMGPCMEPECGGDVYLKTGDGVTRCVECDRGYDVAEMQAQLHRALESRLVKRDELRRHLDIIRKPGTPKVPTGTLRQWIHRGRLVPVIREPELFRLTDAMELAGIERVA